MGILDKLNEGLRSAGIIEDELPEDPAKAGTPVATSPSDEEPPITRRVASSQRKTSYPITRRAGDPAMAIPPDSANTNNVRAYEPENVVDPETFTKLIDEVNAAAPPILNSFLEKLGKMQRISNERDRYEAALIAVDGTREMLLAAMDTRLTKLDSEEREYEEVIKQATDERVGDKLTERERINAEIDALNAQADEIRRQMANKTKEMETIDEEVAEERADIEAASKTFKVTAEQVRKSLIAEREKAGANLSQG